MPQSFSDPRRLGPRRWWALGAVSLAVLAVGLDGTVLSVALPTLATRLHASESQLQWFSSSYLLVLAAAMLPAGVLGDRYGRKRVMLIALALFAVGSAACAASSSSGGFIAARALLGIAGAGVIVMAVSALTVLFDERERPKAVGVWAAANFLAIPIGPILGGWLLTHYWWGWVFLMNVPVTVLGFVVVATLVPESRAVRRPGLDPVGIVTSVAGLVGVTYGLIEAGEHGWGTAGALLPIAGGLALLAAFIAWERRLGRRPGGRPLLDLRLFRSASFTWGVILAAIAVMAMIGVLFTMPQYFQGVLGTDAMGSGVRLLPLIGGLIAGALPADRLVHAAGAKLVAALGFALIAVGLLLGAEMSATSGAGSIAIWMAVLGAGMGLATATASSAALSELSDEHSGVGSAVLQAVNKTGGPFGAAILGSVLTSAYLARLQLVGVPAAAAHLARESVFGGVAVAQRLHSPALLHSVRAAFVHGTDQALVVSAAIALAGVLLAILFLPAARLSADLRPSGTESDVAVST
ncbi:MAG TPA: DHA2 family efflux MFS transporter permease subunit [Solirubrobacteraceae bacterium]|nr:DHA2 family efflux MFS transporter permease subunit [Solirubrobacteraceae bacterium]